MVFTKLLEEDVPHHFTLFLPQHSAFMLEYTEYSLLVKSGISPFSKNNPFLFLIREFSFSMCDQNLNFDHTKFLLHTSQQEINLIRLAYSILKGEKHEPTLTIRIMQCVFCF